MADTPSVTTGDSFVHLHCHTEYSMLDGAARIGELVAAAAGQGMPAIAMTDHGNVFGAYEFWSTARAAGVTPIVGTEAYVTPGTSRFDKVRVRWGDNQSSPGDDVSGSGAYTHLTLLAETTAGMHNLFRLSSLASLEGFFYKPRMDTELLDRHHEGIIATTGCPSGEVQTRLRLGQYEQARGAAAELRDLFGAGNLYCELMDHGLDIERRVREDLLRIARDLDLPLVATNDLHYTRREDAAAHEVLLCVQSGSRLDDPKRFKFDGDGYHLKTAAEMRRLFAELPDACDNTLAIAERCHVEFAEGADLMPRFPVPEGETEASWFAKEVVRGLHRRYGADVPAEVRKQAEYEVDVITQKGYPSYFLVVADFIGWAKEQGIRVGPGRGSAAGSLVAYAMGITDLDPLRHGLIFERFLNPERASMPDIDIDFDERRRGEVIEYCVRRYGDARVAYIVTYGTIKAKQAIKDSARVLGHPFSLGERLTKAMPPAVMGKDIPLSGIFDPQHRRYPEAAEFRQLYDAEPEVREVVDRARGLENLKRQWGVHAAGIIIGRDALLDHVPVMRREADGATITQFDYPTCETLGLLKMDFLGLRNLTVIDDALRNIERNGKLPLQLESLGLDDPATYELLARGDTLGVFQLDGGPMRSLLRLMRPDNFEDISAVLALYRPGPMGADSHTNYAKRKNRLQAIDPIHPELAEPLAEILDTTYGLIVYQEQVMAIAQKVAGYSLGKADLLRRAMGKKKKEVLEKEYDGFAAGMRANGYSDGAVTALWDILLPFSDYAFNKAHTAGYGLVSYWTAYLKANYACEYMAALLTSVRDDKDKSAVYLAECRRMHIDVLPPDVNTSARDFTPVGDAVRFGLEAVRNVGGSVVDAIVSARTEHGPFADFADFLDKVPAVVCNKRTVESLVAAGAFDSLGHTRRSLTACFDEAVDAAVALKRKQADGQFDLFAGLGGEAETASALAVTVPELPEWDKRERLSREREMLGLYVSDHPLRGLEAVLGTLADRSVADVTGEEAREAPPPEPNGNGWGRRGARVTVAGLVTSIQRKMSRAGQPWAVVTVEDLTASVEVLVFPQVYAVVGPVLAEDTVVVVAGEVHRSDDSVTLRAQDVTIPDIATQADRPAVVIVLPVERCTPPVVERLKDVLGTHPGVTEVRLKLTQPGRATLMRLDDRLRVDASAALFGDLKALLGPSCLV
jgi:DNA polymerase-3 subunit alpha